MLEVAKERWHLSMDQVGVVSVGPGITRFFGQVLKKDFPSPGTMVMEALTVVQELRGETTGLTLEKRLASSEAASCFETEEIELEQVGDFVMGYGPKSRVLAFRERDGEDK